MAASRARWLVTASRTGCGGKAAPALLKWRTLATPGVSDLSDGTSSVIFVTASWYAHGGNDATHGPAPSRRGSSRDSDFPTPDCPDTFSTARNARLFAPARAGCRRFEAVMAWVGRGGPGGGLAPAGPRHPGGAAT